MKFAFFVCILLILYTYSLLLEPSFSYPCVFLIAAIFLHNVCTLTFLSLEFIICCPYVISKAETLLIPRIVESKIYLLPLHAIQFNTTSKWKKQAVGSNERGQFYERVSSPSTLPPLVPDTLRNAGLECPL